MHHCLTCNAECNCLHPDAESALMDCSHCDGKLTIGQLILIKFGEVRQRLLERFVINKYNAKPIEEIDGEIRYTVLIAYPEEIDGVRIGKVRNFDVVYNVAGQRIVRIEYMNQFNKGVHLDLSKQLWWGYTNIE